MSSEDPLEHRLEELQDPPPSWFLLPPLRIRLGSLLLLFLLTYISSSSSSLKIISCIISFPSQFKSLHRFAGRSEVKKMGQEDERWVLTKTARAPSNIAVIKYWGKRDEKLILPINSSISITLDPEHLSATTTVAASPAFESDRLWLNGKVSGCVLSSSPS